MSDYKEVFEEEKPLLTWEMIF